MLKNLPANAGDVRDEDLIPGWQDPLEKGTATHSSSLAWAIPWTEEPGWAAVHRVTQSWTVLKRLKEISPGISLEGMMLKLKLQYFGHLMRSVDSLEKTLMLGGIGAGRQWDDRG